MKGDFTRFTFRPEKHYRSVRVQQGRVQVDADWNEQADIAIHRDDAVAGDMIGHQGAPWNGGGFQVGQFVVPRSLSAVHFASATLGFAAGAEGTILKTTDGTNWSRQASTTTQMLRGICAVTSAAAFSGGFAVGEGGMVLHSADGNTWGSQSVPSSATLHGVFTLDGARAIAVGDGGVILQTKDATVASPVWSAIGPTVVAANLHAIHMLVVGTATHIFIVGEGGMFLHGSISSAGADVTWDAPVQKVGASLNAVYFLDDKNGFAVGAPAAGESRTIWKVSAGGATWTAQQVSGATVTADLRGIHFAADGKTGVIVGDEGTILFTADGATWNLETVQPAVTRNLRGVGSAAAAGAAWHAVGDGSTMLASNDGQKWTAQSAPAEWAISPGHLYVDGILCENERFVGLSTQPDFDPVVIAQNQLIYLDVWERHLTAFDRPELREVALGGPDTTTRVRTVWQVKTTARPQGGCDAVDSTWSPGGNRTTGRLAARAAPVPPVTDICVVPPSGGYRRLENQLYRIEIVDAGDTTKGGTSTFTWSRDNGSTVAPIDRIDGSTIKLLNPGTNPVALAGFAGASVVEVIDDPSILDGKPGVVVMVDPIQDSTLAVAAADAGKTLPSGRGAIVRRWESKPINVQPGQWIELGIDRGGGQTDKEGIQVRFDAGIYNVGDYWVIPARTLTGSIEWPSDDDEALFKPPDGVLHHYCALATTNSEAPNLISDCRGLFPWLPDLSSVAYVGGDGQEVIQNQPLVFPLRVSVPFPSAMVRFTPNQGTITADGQTATSLNHLDVKTQLDHTAQVSWTLAWDPAVPANQRFVEAVLLDPSGFKRGRPVRFSATLAQAKNTYYDPTACAALTGVTDVQGAIDAVLGLTTIRYVSGDGQQALPYRPLVQPLQVGVSSTCGPTAGTVRFTADGNGQLAPAINQFGSPAAANPLDVQAVNGIAQCAWLPDPRSKQAGQHVRAQLLDKNGQPTGIPLLFTTSLSPGLHIMKLALGVGRDLQNDMTIGPAELAQGILAECDGAIDQASMKPPVVTVTLDVPYPIFPAEREFFGIQPQGGPSVAFNSLVLPGQVQISGTTIRWLPVPIGDVLKWMDRLMAIGGTLNLPRLLARLKIHGNAIWSSEQRLNLDGDVFLGLDGKPDMRLPSGDGQLGGDFEMWFWVGRQ